MYRMHFPTMCDSKNLQARLAELEIILGMTDWLKEGGGGSCFMCIKRGRLKFFDGQVKANFSPWDTNKRG